MLELASLLIRGSRHVQAARRLRGDQRGNFTVIFGLSALALVVIVGMGIDFLTGLSFKARWDTSADAAALAAIQTGANYLKTNAGSQTNPALTNNAIAAANAAGIKAFNANAGVSEQTEAVTPTLSTSVSGTVVTASVTYSGKITSHFGPLVGIQTLNVSGSATATTSMPTYINYYIIVDVSQSMGVGATQTDMTNLYNRTMQYGNASDGESGCVFGCHVPGYNNNGTVQTYSNEYLAHYVSPAITLRIDSAITAIQDIIGQAQSANNTGGNLKIGLYTMASLPVVTGNPGAPYYATISSPTSNFTTLSTLASTIDLDNVNAYWGWGDSDFPDSFSDFNSGVLANASSGTGYNSASPLNYVFIITDGVQDTYGTSCSSTYDHCISALSSSLCAQFKTKATVGVIYTTYLPVYKANNSANGLDSEYSLMVAPIISQVPANLQACASSSSYYYEASDGPALISAMQQLFASTYSASRISQ